MSAPAGRVPAAAPGPLLELLEEAAMAKNDGISGGYAAGIWPGIASPDSTGAGKGSDSRQEAAAADLGTVPVSVVGQSSQVPLSTVRVDSADTFGGTSDSPNELGFAGGQQSTPAWHGSEAHVQQPEHYYRPAS